VPNERSNTIVKLNRELAARTEINPERRSKLSRTNNGLFIEIQRERGGGRVPFTADELTAMRGGFSAEEYRLKFIRKWDKR
jgi:hypothetical protein